MPWSGRKHSTLWWAMYLSSARNVFEKSPSSTPQDRVERITVICDIPSCNVKTAGTLRLASLTFRLIHTSLRSQLKIEHRLEAP